MVERLVGGGHHGRMQRQAQVVVGREGHDLVAVLDEQSLGPAAVEGDRSVPRPLGFEAPAARFDQ